MSNDTRNVSVLQRMRRIRDRLRERSDERAELDAVIAGLSAGDFFEEKNHKTTFKTDNAEQARERLMSLLPRLNEILPDDPDVQALAERYAV